MSGCGAHLGDEARPQYGLADQMVVVEMGRQQVLHAS